MRVIAVTVLLCAALPAQVEWPMAGGVDNMHFTKLSQITPENVGKLQEVWRFDKQTTSQKGSEMQTNPIVIGGVMYITSPKLRVFALDAATGKELWQFDPEPDRKSKSTFRNRGRDSSRKIASCSPIAIVSGNFDRSTGKPIQKLLERMDLSTSRNDLWPRPPEGVTISATSPWSRLPEPLHPWQHGQRNTAGLAGPHPRLRHQDRQTPRGSSTRSRCTLANSATTLRPKTLTRSAAARMPGQG